MNIEAIIPPLFWAIGIGGFCHSLWALLSSLSAKSWPTAIGEIISSGIDVTRDSDGDYNYEARVEYKFEVRGKHFKGKRIGYGLSSWNIPWFVSSAYKKATKSYPKVKVRYRPDNPNKNTILAGLQVFHLANLAFFTVWCLVLHMALTSQASGTP